MSEYKDKAIKKLNDEFDSHKTFHECIMTISKSIGNACSDHDVYEAAANFYFKGAKVYMTPTIDLIGDAGKAKPTTSAGFDFDDFF